MSADSVIGNETQVFDLVIQVIEGGKKTVDNKYIIAIR